MLFKSHLKSCSGLSVVFRIKFKFLSSVYKVFSITWTVLGSLSLLDCFSLWALRHFPNKSFQRALPSELDALPLCVHSIFLSIIVLITLVDNCVFTCFLAHQLVSSLTARLWPLFLCVLTQCQVGLFTFYLILFLTFRFFSNQIFMFLYLIVLITSADFLNKRTRKMKQRANESGEDEIKPGIKLSVRKCAFNMLAFASCRVDLTFPRN